MYCTCCIPLAGTNQSIQDRAGEHFGGYKAKFSIHYDEILLRTSENFEHKNKILECSIIIIIIIIIIKAFYYKCMAKLLYGAWGNVVVKALRY